MTGQPRSRFIPFTTPEVSASRQSTHWHTAAERGWAFAVSHGNQLGTNPRGVGNRKGDKPEEARGPWRWPRESQADA